MASQLIGSARESGRAVYIAESPTIEELPGLINVPYARFVLLLAYDHGGPPARLTTALAELLERGCVYLCAWGPGSSHIEDMMDEVSLERDLAGHIEETVMTTSHEAEPLAEAVDFALRLAVPDEALAPGCDAIVLAAVGNPAWTQELRSGAEKHMVPPVL